MNPEAGPDVSKSAVEDVLLSHRTVLECAVIDVPDRVRREQVGAVIVLRPGTKIAADELARYAGSRLSPDRAPTRWWFRRDPLPRDRAGVVLEQQLQNRLAGS